MIIKVLLLIVLVAGLVYFGQNRSTMRLKAGFKIAFIAFAVFAFSAIIRPDWVTTGAHLVGVGRGADLLLYCLVFAFVFFVLGSYLKFKEYERRLAKLARHIALTEAELKERQ